MGAAIGGLEHRAELFPSAPTEHTSERTTGLASTECAGKTEEGRQDEQEKKQKDDENHEDGRRTPLAEVTDAVLLLLGDGTGTALTTLDGAWRLCVRRGWPGPVAADAFFLWFCSSRCVLF